ncbi:DegT/DnrJ/EryC1/StrS family aminotransferase [Actinomadura sp. KC216]|nr:DegT/DnrJ/EryC1/StrS family aminotransferase [Actinomadura sp. KC216]
MLDILYQLGTSQDEKLILGKATAELERAIAEQTGARHVIACASGTGALTLSVHALDIGPGDEVVVPAFCCQPVASTVANLGATVVFADVDPLTMVMDPGHTESLIGDRTRAIMPAHVFSIMADMPRFREIAERRSVALIEDAAVAQGAVLDGLQAGRWGDLGVVSFFQVKAFGTAGEGGMVFTDDTGLATAVRQLRNHGQDGVNRFLHHRVGYNSRLDEAIARFQLHRLPGFAGRLERRAQIADYYSERFSGLADRGLTPPPAGRNGRCYYVYSLLVERREDLRAYLTEREIGTHIYYPVPLPRQPAFSAIAAPGRSWPNAELVSARNLAIPIWPHLSDAQVEYIADSVCEFFE